MKIGVGVTTRNRPEILTETLLHIRKHTPDATIVVVDDASKIPEAEATFRFDTNAGIARAKNKCMELLVDAGCDELFLFDDDAYPITDEWWRPYVESPEPHLMRIFPDLSGPRKLRDITTVYRDTQHYAYTASRGVMLYANRVVIDRVGGMDPAYGLWGYEHGAWSNRIHCAGLTTWRFADVTDSEKLIYCLDEHEAVDRSVDLRTRKALIRPNLRKYQAEYNASHYVNYREPRDVVLTCLFTGRPDPQRKTGLPPDPALLDTLLRSLRAHDPVVLHNELDTDDPRFQQVETAVENPYFQRWLSYWQWLRAHPEVRFAWCVDGTDVELLHDPYPNMQPDTLYVGSEPAVVGCRWLRANHHAKVVTQFIDTHADRQLLNAGLVGGDRTVLLEFLHRMIRLMWDNLTDQFHRHDSKDLGVTDMAALNYVAWTAFEDRLVYGPQVNTVFKANDRANPDAWWRHK